MSQPMQALQLDVVDAETTGQDTLIHPATHAAVALPAGYMGARPRGGSLVDQIERALPSLPRMLQETAADSTGQAELAAAAGALIARQLARPRLTPFSYGGKKNKEDFVKTFAYTARLLKNYPDIVLAGLKLYYQSRNRQLHTIDTVIQILKRNHRSLVRRFPAELIEQCAADQLERGFRNRYFCTLQVLGGYPVQLAAAERAGLKRGVFMRPVVKADKRREMSLPLALVVRDDGIELYDGHDSSLRPLSTVSTAWTKAAKRACDLRIRPTLELMGAALKNPGTPAPIRRIIERQYNELTAMQDLTIAKG